jgi:hypothetical protein
LANAPATSTACAKASLIVGLLLFTTASSGWRRHPELVAPRLFQIGNILRIDLRQWRETRAAKVAVVHRPVGIGGCLCGARLRERGQNQRERSERDMMNTH